MTRMAFYLALFIGAIGWVSTVSAADLIKKQSSHPVAVTLDRLESILKERSITVMARIDHQKGAEKAGLTLRPTQLLLFGNPALGTRLMQLDQSIGMALPMKVLSWQDADGAVWIGYEPPGEMAAHYGISADHDVIRTMSGALDRLTSAAITP